MLNMVSITLNTVKQIMRTMVNSPGYDRVLSKVNGILDYNYCVRVYCKSFCDYTLTHSVLSN